MHIASEDSSKLSVRRVCMIFSIVIIATIVAIGNIFQEKMLDDASTSLEIKGNNSLSSTKYILARYQTDLTYASNALNASMKDIYNFWDVDHFPLFMQSVEIPTVSWDMYKFKFIKAIVTAQASLSPSLSHVTLPKFVVGFSGSSVTAGHDNFESEAYPAVFENVLRPIFLKLGIDLEV
jgi:hypothetical protein